MEGNGKITLPGQIDEVFDELQNPELLKKCIMGCKKMEKSGEQIYDAELQMGIASVKGKYDATISLEDVQRPNHYKLVVHGEGKPGIVDAEGSINLLQEDDEQTLLEYTYTAEVAGKVASISQRMLGGVAKLIINDFFKKAKKEMNRQKESS